MILIFTSALLQRQNVVNTLQLNEKRFSLNLHLTQLYSLKSPGQLQCNACVCLRFCYVVGAAEAAIFSENGGNN
jgi:hypothetical protein